MFVEFFYTLRDRGVPVKPTSFLKLQKALGMGLICSVEDFYTAARSILVKSERYFDLYDQVFAHHFEGAELKDPAEWELAEVAKTLLQEWLKDPEGMAQALGADAKELSKLTPEEKSRVSLDIQRFVRGVVEKKIPAPSLAEVYVVTKKSGDKVVLGFVTAPVVGVGQRLDEGLALVVLVVQQLFRDLALGELHLAGVAQVDQAVDAEADLA